MCFSGSDSMNVGLISVISKATGLSMGLTHVSFFTTFFVATNVEEG